MTSDTREISKTYDPAAVEKKWYKIWEDGKYFKPKKGKADDSYCIIMPPPNVTGRLHMGHALDVVTQDLPTRFKRMKGFETLWLPGMDHAGIATQNVVEKQLLKEEGKSKKDLSREEFLEKIWKWKEESGGIIAQQQRSLGASPDWDYSMFTMDPEAHEAVKKVFVNLYNEGLIYQGEYIINWDPKLQSAISDAEVEHKEVKGAFYHILYQVKDSDIKLEVATTRPETLLGDTAVAVNPTDERFKHLIGKKAIIPICNREVPIVGDEHVDVELGTGCLKVTPGHDFNDFEIGQRHQLPIINILNKDGTLNENAGDYQGESCLKARPKIIEKLKELEILVDIKEHVHQVGHGDRSKAVIEPLVSKQWFLNVQDMAKDAVDAIETDKTCFIPKQWENTYFSWLREPKNWCISRQLVWGHQIPVFDCNDCGHQWASETEGENCPKCNARNVTQDPDVLDTWFSSGLWPLSTLGWPNEQRMKERGFDTFYPTSVLVTGFDIIFFWVARMMMMNLKEVKQVPFEKIYIHAIVRDKQGRKMSKSLGNGIEPLEMVEKYGADALRFSLAAGSGYNRNINLDPDRIEGYRNFINKIWNAFRFIHPFIDDVEGKLPETAQLGHQDKWIISELNELAKNMNSSIEEFRFDDACSSLYSFIYDSFCSNYIELSKGILYGDDESAKLNRANILKFCFKEIVKLLHPVSPYITEELWEYLKDDKEDLIIVQDYPEYIEALNFPEDQEKMQQFLTAVTSIRNLRASVNIKPKEEVNALIFSDDEMIKNYFASMENEFQAQAKTAKLEIKSKSEKRPEKSVMAASERFEIFLPLDGVIDLSEQVKRIEKELKKVKKDHAIYAKKLKNERFMNNAPDEVVVETREKESGLREKIDSLEKSLVAFQ